MFVCVFCGGVLTSSLRLLTKSTPPGPECPDSATLPAAAAAALRGLMAPTERKKKRGRTMSAHITRKSRRLSISARSALWPCILTVCTQHTKHIQLSSQHHHTPRANPHPRVNICRQADRYLNRFHTDWRSGAISENEIAFWAPSACCSQPLNRPLCFS